MLYCINKPLFKTGWDPQEIFMSLIKRVVSVHLAILIALAATACGATAPKDTPAATPSDTPTTTLTPTPLFTGTPTYEMEQRPSLPAPVMGGDIDVGGHILSYKCYGEGSPTIIVEAGAGDKPTLTLSWNAVILGVSPTTRMCIYDRVPANSSQEMAENLHGLLSKIPVAGPYILVAHSLGGWHARVFAHLYPDEVAGMVLVDTTPVSPQSAITYATAYPTVSAGEPAGITQNRMTEADIYAGELMPSLDGLDMKVSNEQAREAGTFGEIPLVAIGRIPGPENFPGLDPVSLEQLDGIMLKIEADMAKLSSKGVFVLATTHQHFISLYEPQIIIDAINKMVEEVRMH
jgi:pimeloyl-ACP methyl ester carboxylesterase